MNTLEWAQRYIARGWMVVPLFTVDAQGQCTCGKKDCSDAGKHPTTKKGLAEGSRDPKQIEAWFGTKAKPRNIGILTGEVSGLTVLDIDIGDGKEGAESWAKLIEGHGEPDTLIGVTGSGGTHVLFRYNSALSNWGGSRGPLGPNIDCRNDGGYIVACPSRHRSGGVYQWVDWEKLPAILPGYIARKKLVPLGRPKKDDPFRGRKYTEEQVKHMLSFVPSDDRDLWRSVGIILGRTFNRSDEAWTVYHEWSDTYQGKKGRGHNEIMHEAFHVISQQKADSELGLGTIINEALQHGWAPKAGEIPETMFVYYAPGNNYLHAPTGLYWIAPAVNSGVSPINQDGTLVKAADWIREHRLVSSLTCDPTLDEELVRGVDCREGQLIPSVGAAIFNTYRAPTLQPGDARFAQPWVDHVRRLMPKEGDADQFFNYLAHRVQRPGEKPRFALLIGGGQGVGKDTAVDMCVPAIGEWNVRGIDPSAFDSSFNEFAAAVLVRINEAANLQDMTKWAFNERTKVLISGNPDFATINPKYGQKFSLKMFCGVIMTTNHLVGGIHLPPDDRRYDVIECATFEEMGLTSAETRAAYFTQLYSWYYQPASRWHIAAWLHERSLKDWSASSGQRKTAGHRAIVMSSMAADAWALEALEDLGMPALVKASILIERGISHGEKKEAIVRKLPHILSRLGYTAAYNPNAADGRWKLNGTKYNLYMKVGTVINKSLLDLASEQSAPGAVGWEK